MSRPDFVFKSKTPKALDNGSSDLRAALDRQLRQLRAWEDPADTSPVAVVYREMLVAATAKALNGGRTAEHSLGYQKAATA